MHKLLFTLYATLLAGTHMADFNMPHSPPEAKAVIIPIQGYYNYGSGYYGWGGRSYPNYGGQWRCRGEGCYRRGMSDYDYGRDMTPEDYYGMRQRRYQYRGGYNNPPWFGNGW